MKSLIMKFIGAIDLTQIFKTKGDVKRWSAKRTIGGMIVATACGEIVANGVTWEGVAMCLIGIVPLCLSFAEKN